MCTGFQCVQAPEHIETVPLKCPNRWQSQAALGEMTAVLKIFSNLVC